MIYLIGQLAIWIVLTIAFAALAGAAIAAERAAPDEEKRRREREQLLQDLIRYAGDGADMIEPERDDDSAQRFIGIRDARIAELERSLETARARVDEVSGALAERERRGQLNDPDAEELARLRALEAERARTVEAEAEEENGALQAWRLRYFEQRVKYLETHARELAATAPPVSVVSTKGAADETAQSVQEWLAREAAARVAFLEEELRAARRQAPEPEPEPFAADADVDMLLRWRMLYLERRVAHLQSQAQAALAPIVEVAPDPDRWKWRARYLEARVRHLEQRGAPAKPTPEPAPARAKAAPPSRRAKPAVLAAARTGAPDDLTLIEGVSLMQQTTLYALGVFHFDQIAAWDAENIAWVDQYLRLDGRIEEEEWIEQAVELAEHGPAAARRAFESEEA